MHEGRCVSLVPLNTKYYLKEINKVSGRKLNGFVRKQPLKAILYMQPKTVKASLCEKI